VEYKWLPLNQVLAWEPAAARLGVSKVARGRSGFLRAYEGGRLTPSWEEKRHGFIARHVAQAEAKGEPWFRDGAPTRRHLALIMWGYSPQPGKLRRPNPAPSPQEIEFYSEGACELLASALAKRLGYTPVAMRYYFADGSWTTPHVFAVAGDVAVDAGGPTTVEEIVSRQWHLPQGAAADPQLVKLTPNAALEELRHWTEEEFQEALDFVDRNADFYRAHKSNPVIDALDWLREPDEEIRDNPVSTDSMKTGLARYREFVDWFSSVGTASIFKTGSLDSYLITVALKRSVSEYRNRYMLSKFFPNILSTYAMSNSDRKVIEKAAKDTSRTTVRISARAVYDIDGLRLDAAIETYQNQLAAYKMYGEVAARVIYQGSSVETVKTDGFQLVNAGGFSGKVMAQVESVVGEAAERLRAAGFGFLIYGDVNIVGSITNKTSVLALYDLNTDEIYVRANMRKSDPAVRTIIHELAHRLEYKFFKGERRLVRTRKLVRVAPYPATERLYEKISEMSDVSDLVLDKSTWPKPGEKIISGSKSWEVTSIYHDSRRKPIICVRLVTDARPRRFGELPQRQSHVEGRLSMESYLKGKNSAFVTSYARTAPSENLAEMVAEYCMGSLDPKLETLLKTAIREGMAGP